MSAAEVIKQIKKLAPEERRTVICFLKELMEGINKDAETMANALNDARITAPSVKYIPKEKFEAAKKRVFTENRELLARLAK